MARNQPFFASDIDRMAICFGRRVTTGSGDLFAANPDRYSPQYGGYCALGIAAGEISDVDPKYFTIQDGKIYLNKAMEFRKIWREAPKSHVFMSDYNWENNRRGMRNVLNCPNWPACGYL